MADAPPVKPWGQNDKELLQKLIDRCKINISCTGDTDYIERIRHKYFRPRDTFIFDAPVILRTTWADIVESKEV